MFKYAASASVALIFSAFLTTGATAETVYFQGFESDALGWTEPISEHGSVTRTGSTNGVDAFDGSHFGIAVQGTDDIALCCGLGTNHYGPFMRFDHYRDVFPGTYSASVAVYLDLRWASGEGFDYSVASTNVDGNHLRDFIFHVTKSLDSILIGGSNNTNFDPNQGLESGDHYEITDSAWYIFEHVFSDDGGVLSVDLTLRDADGNHLFTETRKTDPNGPNPDTIPGVAGGNRYSWFTNIDVEGGIYIDSLQLDVPAGVVPLPAALPLFGTGVALMGFFGWRRKRKAAA